jgi:nitroreductase
MKEQDDFLSVMTRRFACKLFDQSSSLSDEDAAFILECARLSPSSFGIEHWHFYAVRSRAKITSLRAACFDQDAVGTASLAVVAVCRKGSAYRPDSAFIASRGSRFPGGLKVFVDDYRGYFEYLDSAGLTDSWARAQCYIPCANMMTGAAAAGIDSCAIEGFDDGKVLDLLGLDPELWQTAIVTVFGHAASDEPREKIRMAAREIITYV